jgi:hypothetical protein
MNVDSRCVWLYTTPYGVVDVVEIVSEIVPSTGDKSAYLSGKDSGDGDL